MGPPTRRHVPLRVAVLTLVVGLLLATVGSLAVVSTVTSARSVAELEHRYFTATSQAISGRVRAFLEPALVVLEDTRDQALAKRFSTVDGDDLGRYLLARLSHLPNLAWLSYSDGASGRFVGVWRRDDGVLVLNRSDPAVNGGTPTEHELRPDGTLEAYVRPLKGGYDPRTSAWYRLASEAPGPVWTEPFEFNEGRLGITAALAVRDAPQGPPRGVLTADFFLDGLAKYLQTLTEGGASIDVLTRARNVVASSWCCLPPAEAKKALEPGLSTAPATVETLAPDRPVSWSFEQKGVTRIGALEAFATRGAGSWVTLLSVPEDTFLAGVQGNRRLALLFGGLATLLAVLLGFILARRISKPLGLIADDLERVARFDLTAVAAPASRVREVHVVSDAVDRMKASLRSFGRYVPTALVQELLASGVEAKLGGTNRVLTIFFSDIQGFTAIGEAMEPTALVEHLGSYLDEMTRVVQAAGGTIDKFMGDGILAFFNAPRDLPDHAAAACRAALACQARLDELAAGWRAQGRAPFRARIGLHTGEVLVGNLGTPERFAYTVIGDAVNLASRLESANKRYGTDILVSDATRAAAGPGFEWRTLDRIAVVGRRGGTTVSELMGVAGSLSGPREVRPGRLRSRRSPPSWPATSRRPCTRAREAQAAAPGDAAATHLAARAQACSAYPPPADWDGTEALLEK